MDFQKSNFEVTSEIRRKRNSFNIPSRYIGESVNIADQIY